MATVSTKYKKRHGLDFPAGVPDFTIDLLCWKKWAEPEFACGNIKDPWDLFIAQMKTVLSHDEWAVSRWTEEHVHDWTTENFVITWGCAGSCKAQPLDAVVYTPSGPRLMGDLRVGDRVLAQDGKTAAIIATHDVGVRDEYEVVFRDGPRVLCAGDHLWEVGARGGAWARNHVVTTEWLAASGKPDYFHVPLCEPLFFLKRAAPVPPYLLGVLLGDGCMGGTSGNGQLRLSAADADIVEAARGELPNDYELVSVAESDYMIVKRSREHGKPNKYIRALKQFGLWGKLAHEKFVPEDYLYGDETTRRLVLSGLLDTDGCCGEAGDVSFTSTSERLASDVQFLVWSLGGRSAITSRETYAVLSDGTRKPGRLAYHVSVSLGDKSGLFRSSRKAARLVADKARSVRTRAIVSVSRTGRSVPMKCITIDHPRGLYITTGCVPTHNSNDAGLLALVDWSVDPNETSTRMASTSVDSLFQRNFEATIRYHRILRGKNIGFPGTFIKTAKAIVLSEEEYSKASTKMGLWGIAVREGPLAEAVARIRGSHAPYVRFVCDELSQMQPAVVAPELLINMSVGAKSFKFIGLTNIDALDDLAGKHSVPAAKGGWASVGPDVEFWRTARGVVRRHDGFKSPAIEEPDGDKKYPFLLNRKRLDELIVAEGGNEDAPAIWRMVRAWPPAVDSYPVPVTATETVRWKMRPDSREIKPRWAGKPTPMAALDPGYGGDKASLQLAWAGFLADGGAAIVFEDTPRIVPVKASDPLPVVYQIARYCIPILNMAGVKGEHLAIDDSGPQSVADVFSLEWSRSVARVSFGSRATEFPVSAHKPDLACDTYSNLATEIVFLFREFGQYGQLWNVPYPVLEQLTSRQVDRVGGKLRLASKELYKKQTGRGSPDELDAAAMCLYIARHRVGLVPGSSEINVGGPVSDLAPGGPSWTNPDVVKKMNNLGLTKFQQPGTM